MTNARRAALLLAPALLALCVAGRVAAQTASWLDGPLRGWNVAGAPVPRAPATFAAPDPRCTTRERGPVGAEESAVATAGWRLEASWPSRRAGDLTVVLATFDYDGMCRPAGFQGFVFVGGRYAGTLSPDPMVSRVDGALVPTDDGSAARVVDGRIVARFVRYAPTDPLCCPSRGHARVTYRIDREAAGPVAVPAELVAEPPAAPAPAPSASPTPPTPTQLPRTGGAAPLWVAALAAAGALLAFGGLSLRPRG